VTRAALAALALAVSLSATATAAAAAPLPTLGAADGVSMTHVGTEIQVRFSGAAATAAASYVGHELSIWCERQPVSGLALADTSSSSGGPTATLKQAADGTLTLAGHFSSDPFDVCAVRRPPRRRVVGRDGPFVVETGTSRPPLARDALTPAGATWIEELGHAIALQTALAPLADLAAYPLPAAFARPGVVALDGPDGTPPAGAVGYWSDGARRAAAATVSGAGRRLVYEDLGGGMTRTNTGPFAEAVDAARGGRAYLVDIARADRDAHRFAGRRPRVATAEDGVRASLAGTRLTVRFAGRSAKALRAVAGRRLSVACNAARVPDVFLGIRALLDGFQLVGARAPRRGTVLRARVRAGAADLCSITDDGAAVALVAATAAGRGVLTDLQAASVLLDGPVLAPQGATAYPPAATLVAKHKADLVALSGPDAFPPAGRRAGVWTGGDRAVMAVTSPTGHRYVVADEGNGVLRANVDQLFLQTLLLTYTE
jgi:hypothetical protein